MKNLAIILSKLYQFTNPNFRLEQYSTDSQIVFEILQYASLKGDIEDKVVADFGCGNGVFGIGCLLLGAKKVYFIDIDEKCLKLTVQNIKYIESEMSIELMNKAEFACKDITSISDESLKDVELIIQNPPFGTKNKNVDTKFLDKAMKNSKIIYSFHKYSTQEYIEKYISQNNFKATNVWKFNFLLRNTMSFHTKHKTYIDVVCFRIEKN